MSEVADGDVIIEVHVTFGSEEEARRVARAAVEQRLAACANLFAPVHSIYRWEGAVQAEDEVAVVFKTAEARRDDLIAFIVRNHSYDVPGIIVHRPTNVSQPYRAWVNDETR
jgi:periplasmic divalent cation tolerance protein